jgi:hypothetical protein
LLVVCACLSLPRGMRFSCPAMLLLACAALQSQRAHAERRRFEWQGPDCLTNVAMFHGRLETLVGEADLRRLSGRVGVARQGERWLVELTIDLDGKRLGKRHFDAKSCDEASETAAVAASMAVFDGVNAGEAATASGLSPDIWRRRADPEPDFTPELPARTPEPTARIEPRLGVLGVAAVGALPRPAFGAGVEGELAFGDQRYSAALIGSVTAQQERRVDERKSVTLRAFAATIRGCAAPAWGTAYRIDGCAGLGFTMVRGRGNGFDVNRSASLLWVAPLLGSNLSLRAPRYIEWRLEFDASLPLSRRRFLADGEQVSRPAVLVLGLRFGPILRFP